MVINFFIFISAYYMINNERFERYLKENIRRKKRKTRNISLITLFLLFFIRLFITIEKKRGWMNAELNYFNSKEAAVILGVNVSTIKRWTDEGRLECIQSPGGHRKFFIEHLAEFLRKNKNKTHKATLFPAESSMDLQITSHILRGNYTFLIDYFYRQSMKCNLPQLQQVLNGLYLAQFPLPQIYDQLIVPVLKSIGDKWQKGSISIFEEHLASQAIRGAIDRLQGIIRLPKNNIAKVICALPPGELHDIPLKMVQHILEMKGYKVYFSGQNTPLQNLIEIGKKFKVKRIYLSSTVVVDLEQTTKELMHLYDECLQANIDVYVGGMGFDVLPFEHRAVVRRLYHFEDVFHY